MAAGPNADHPTPEDLEISRYFAAPRPLVFSMWTEPEHFVCWFGPHGTLVDGCTLDPRPGGVFAFRHRHRGGAVMHVKGAFDEVVSPERLVFTSAFVDANGQPCAPTLLPGWPLEARLETTVLLFDADGGTRMTLRQRVKPPELAGLAVVKHQLRGAREGWSEVLDRLTEHLKGL